MEMAPSPTAEATRFTLLERTSPTAKTPGRGANSNRRQPFGYYPKALSVSCRCRINGEKNYKKRIKKEKLDHEKSYPTSHSFYVSAVVLKPTVRHQQTTKRHSRNPRRTMPRT